MNKILFLNIMLLFWGCQTLTPPPPVSYPSDPTPSPEASSVNLLIEMDREAIESVVNKALPSSFTGKNKGEKKLEFAFISYNWNYNWDYLLTPGKITFELENNTVTARTRLSGKIKANWDPLGAGEADVTADVKITSRVGLNSTWELTSQTDVDIKLDKADLEVGIEVAGQTIGVTVSLKTVLNIMLQNYLKEIAGLIDREVSKLDVKSYAASAWALLKDPIEVNKIPPVWLSLTPIGINFSGIQTDNEKLSIVTGMKGFVKGVLGAKPASTDPGGLPLLNPDSGTPGFKFNFPVGVEYSYLEKEVNKEISGKKFTVEEAEIELHSIGLSGNGNHINIKVDLATKALGDLLTVSGLVYFTGRPIYDNENHILTIEDFDFDLNTKNFLANTANWLLHDTFKETIAKELTWNLKSKITDARKMANGFLKNVKIIDGVDISANLTTIEVKGLYLSTEQVIIDALFNGKAELFVKNIKM